MTSEISAKFFSLKLLTPLLLLGLVGCNSSSYPSELQAREACERWELKGEVIPYTSTSIGKTSKRNRKCTLENSTKQYLGKEGKFSDAERAKANKTFIGFDRTPKATDWKVVRHFRY
jgi:hypothetical protein|tara:strand:- start:37 stop:387 length:351 start_codon:yes stop_codon:yes gene_type:complete